MVESFELSGEYSIVEINLPEKCVGKTVEEIAFRKNYNLAFLTVIKKVVEKTIFGKVKRVNEVMGVVNYESVLENGDILVLYGANQDIEKFIKEN